MPIGIVTDTDFESELKSLGIASQSNVEITIDIPTKGRNGKEEVPESVRALIASEAISGANPAELAETFKVSKSSISAYKHGATSTTTYHEPDTRLVKALEITRESIIGPAQRRLMDAIEAITPEKLGEAKVNNASAVARDMSAIIKNLTPDSQQVVNNQVVIFKPRMKEEDDYEVINVTE